MFDHCSKPRNKNGVDLEIIMSRLLLEEQQGYKHKGYMFNTKKYTKINSNIKSL